VLASYNGKTIAGAMYFHLGSKTIYKYGASDKKYLHLRPNNLVMWEAIKWYSTNGFRSLSFGRTAPDSKGLRQFKAGWGTDETTIKYYTYDLIKKDFITRKPPVSGFHKKVFNAMPINLLKITGSLLYKHMG
jgi:lipid II:glycine glycyltransferase (peptidoglycan interpeptide bridge formation enzyme)